MSSSTGIALSILTPAVPSRWEQLQKLTEEIARQIGSAPVEHLILLDNKQRSIGRKRDNLLRLARGHYVAFVDDDDWIAPDYVSSILDAGQSADVITFEQVSTVNGLTSRVIFGLGQPNEPFNPDGITRRNAWHVCAWRRSLAILSAFTDCNYGEDWAFAARLCAVQGLKETHLPKVLHYYRHDSKTTEAPPP